MEIELEPRGRSRAAGLLGLGSFALLAASFRWAHHWGLLADTIVVSWALTTISAACVSAWSLQTTRDVRGYARLGLALTAVSLLALTVTAVLFAAGTDVAEQCGGG